MCWFGCTSLSRNIIWSFGGNFCIFWLFGNNFSFFEGKLHTKSGNMEETPSFGNLGGKFLINLFGGEILPSIGYLGKFSQDFFWLFGGKLSFFVIWGEIIFFCYLGENSLSFGYFGGRLSFFVIWGKFSPFWR